MLKFISLCTISDFISHDNNYHRVLLVLSVGIDLCFVMPVLFSGRPYAEILQSKTNLKDTYAIQTLCVYQQGHILAAVPFAL